MCGRFTLAQQQWVDSLLAGLDEGSLAELRAARFNIAPGQMVLALRRPEERFEPVAMHWGIAATWPGGPSRIINARDDKLAGSRFWRSMLEGGRCAIPADGFFEWRRLAAGGKQPYWFGAAGGEPFVFAGLCRGDEEHGESCVIITVPANELVEGVHDRMPAMLDLETAEAWLSGDVDEALAALRPYPSARMTARPVSRAVNNVANDGPALVEPVDAPEESPAAPGGSPAGGESLF